MTEPVTPTPSEPGEDLDPAGQPKQPLDPDTAQPEPDQADEDETNERIVPGMEPGAQRR